MIIPSQSLLSDWHSACYRVNDRMTRSKVEALLWANQDQNSVIFDLNDAGWSQQCWQQEPMETWQELCQQRASQLRSQHKKIILWFSGGYDSLTVVWSFIWAGLSIDELLIYKKDWFDENAHDYALKQAQWFKKQYWPKVKIRSITIKHTLSNQYYHDHGDDWIYSVWFRPDFTKNSRLATVNHEIDLLRELDDPSTIMLDGFDKPRLDIIDNNWYNRFTDQGSQWNLDMPIVNFFITTDFPRLQIKQTWLLIKFLEHHGVTTNQQLHDIQSIDRWELTPKPFSYRDFSSAPGRIAPDFWFAREHVNKGFFRGGLKSKEAMPLIKHFDTVDNQAINIYQNGLFQLRTLLPKFCDNSINLPPILGTPHYIKPVQNQKNLMPSSEAG